VLDIEEMDFMPEKLHTSKSHSSDKQTRRKQ